MKIKRIEVDKNICIGCGSCVALAAKAFELKNGKSDAKKDWQNESEENIITASRSCPVLAIFLYDEKNQKIE